MVRLPTPLPKVYFLTALCQPLKIIQDNFYFFLGTSTDSRQKHLATNYKIMIA